MEQRGKDRLEQDLANALTEGEMAEKEPDVAALRRLSPRYEIRTQAERDPIVEETILFRGIAREIDDRYDRYLSKTNAKDEDDDNASS